MHRLRDHHRASQEARSLGGVVRLFNAPQREEALGARAVVALRLAQQGFYFSDTSLDAVPAIFTIALATRVNAPGCSLRIASKPATSGWMRHGRTSASRTA